MKSILRVSKNIYVSFAVIGAFLFVSLVSIMFLKVETSDNIIVSVSQNKKSLLMNSDVVYKIKDSEKVVIRIDDMYTNILLGNTKWNDQKKLFEIEIKSSSNALIPNSTLDAKVIYESKPIYKVIFGIV